MAYTEYSVLVDGADDGTVTFDDSPKGSAEAATWLTKEKAALTRLVMNKQIEVGEIYSLHHGHDQGVEECACAQYITDHNPDFRVGEWI